MSTNTSTEGNGKKEIKKLKVTRTDDDKVTKLIDKYFEDYIENSDKYADLSVDAEETIKNVLSTHALTFKTKDENVKSQLGDDDTEKAQNFVQAIDVLESGKRDFILEEITKGARLNIKLADKDKVKARADKIRKENAEKKAKEAKSGGAEKDDR